DRLLSRRRPGGSPVARARVPGDPARDRRVRRRARQVARPPAPRVRALLPGRARRRGGDARAAARRGDHPAMIAALRRVRAEVLGLNRRNHGYLFRYNGRTGYRLVDDKRATKAVLAAHGVPTPAERDACDAQWRVDGLVARLKRTDGFALKPARGAGGAGIVVVTSRDGD